MNKSVWQPLLERMPDWIDATVMDLPGHGDRTHEVLTDLNGLADDVHRQCKKIKKSGRPLVLIGWSLGGLACLQLALNAVDEIDSYLMVSSTPCFVKKDGWHYGVDEAIFKQFSIDLKKDFSGTIRRFLSLQVKGSESGRATLRDLREKILQSPQPNEKSLEAGLQILLQTDLHESLEKIDRSVNWILGEQDGLVNAQLAETLNQVSVFSKAGHAPFLSHADQFIQQLERILLQV